jgi:hypothetical protein
MEPGTFDIFSLSVLLILLVVVPLLGLILLLVYWQRIGY